MKKTASAIQLFAIKIQHVMRCFLFESSLQILNRTTVGFVLRIRTSVSDMGASLQTKRLMPPNLPPNTPGCQ